VTVKIHKFLLWVMTPCTFVGGSQHFEEYFATNFKVECIVVTVFFRVAGMCMGKYTAS